MALAVYIRTLAPTVGLVDSGELTIAAWVLGNAHPPGFPLYLLLTHAVMFLTPGLLAWRANFASALFAAGSATAMTFVAGELLLLVRRERVAILSLFAGLTLAFSRTLWNYATIAEVYALNTMMLLLVLGLVLVWLRGARVTWMYSAALLFGLALGVHHVTTGLAFLGVAALVIAARGWRFAISKNVAIAAAIAVVACAAVYAYLPIAAAKRPVMNWGDPHDLGRLIDHITAKQYRAYLTGAKAASQLSFATRGLASDLGPVWLPLMLLLAVAGCVFLFRRHRPLFMLVLVTLAANAVWLIVYPIANDQDAYLLPAIVALILAAAAGAAWVAERARWERMTALFLILPALACATAYRSRDRSGFLVPKTLFENVSRAMEPRTLLITDNWNVYAPAFYFIEGEERRPDIKVVELGMLIRGWYLDALQRRYPDLIAPAAQQFAAFRESVAQWESVSPAEWQRMPADSARFNTRLNEFFAAMVTQQIARGPVYVTRDVAANSEQVIQPAMQRLRNAYDVMPRGILLQYIPKGTMPRVAMTPIDTAGLAESEDEVVRNEVIPLYATAFEMRARYLAANRRFDEAVAQLDEAIALMPENPILQQERNVMASYGK
jgi:hypothetical protein